MTRGPLRMFMSKRNLRRVGMNSTKCSQKNSYKISQFSQKGPWTPLRKPPGFDGEQMDYWRTEYSSWSGAALMIKQNRAQWMIHVLRFCLFWTEESNMNVSSGLRLSFLTAHIKTQGKAALSRRREGREVTVRTSPWITIQNTTARKKPMVPRSH